MLEPSVIAKWIYGTLTGDAALAAIVGTRVYEDVAPQGAAMPYIVFQMQSPGNDLNALGSRRVIATPLYVIRGIAQTASYTGNLATIAERIDVLLHGQQQRVGTNDGYVWCYRERPFRLAEVRDGIQYRHSGGVYRILTQSY